MDRFSRLEFGDVRPERARQPGEPERDAGYFLAQARRYALAGDYEVALRNYSRALEQDGVSLAGWSGQVLMLIELGEYREADLWADRALGLFPEHPELLALKAVANQRDAHCEQAVAYSDNAVGRENPTPRVWLARAEVFLNRKDAVVDGCLRKALALADRDGGWIRLEAARLLRRKRNYVGALTYLQQAQAELGEAPLLWLELGHCQAALGQPAARTSFEQALRLRPGWPEAKKALRRCSRGGLWGWLLRHKD